MTGGRTLAIAAVILVALVATSAALRSAPPAYPTGDHAVLELYTLNALESPWPFGPYSRYKWHHPGPLFFYWEAPWYLASGRHTLGMHTGALALSVASLGALLALLVRLAPPTVSLCTALGFGVLALRLDTLSTDFWNPIAVVLPTALLIVLGAGLASGRWRLLPWVALVASFLAQTHVSVVPCVAAVVMLALFLAWRARPGNGVNVGAVRHGAVWAALVMALAWVLPLSDDFRHWPGNLTSIVTFFLEPSVPVPWPVAASTWSRLVTAPLLPGLVLPVGAPDASSTGAPTMALAAAQVALLAGVAWLARSKGDDVLAALAVLGVAVLLMALWSLTRVRGPIGDYLAFWLSAVAVLNWSVILGGALALVGAPQAVMAARTQRPTGVVAILAVVVVTGDGISDISRAVGATRGPQTAVTRQVPILADAIAARLRGSGRARPLLRIGGGVWVASAGVVLELRKRGVRVAVEGDVDFVFSAPPTGDEDAFFALADSTAVAALGDSVTEVARAGGVVVVTSAR